MTTYLEWARRHAPASYPDKVAAAIAAVGNFPQNPNTGVPSSPRVMPGIPAHLVQSPMTQKATDALLCWVAEEEQRHLPDGPPNAVFYDWQTPILEAAWPLNQLDKPVPITLWDSQHLVVDQLLLAMFLHPDMKVRKRAAQQADRLRQAVYKVVLDPVKVLHQGQALSGQARAAGWTLSFIVRMLRALPVADDMKALAVMIDGLSTLTTEQGNLPFVMTNPADQAQDAATDDHGGCGWTVWMILGPYLRGLCEAREFDPNNADLNHLVEGVLDFAAMAFAKGKAHYGMDGKVPDAIDPVKADYYQKGSTMPGWAVMGLREADAQGLLTSGLKASAVALRNATGYLDDKAAKPGMDQKNLSLMILCGGWPGVNWKQAT